MATFDNGTFDSAAFDVGVDAPAPPLDLSLLFIGDSLTAGYYATVEANAFRPLLTASLGGTEAAVFGISGGESHDFLTQGAAITAAAVGVDIVFIELGTNDCVDGGVTPADLAANLVTIMGWCRSGNPDCGLVVCGVWQGLAEGRVVWDAAIQNAASSYGGRFVRLAAIYDDTANSLPSGVSTWVGDSDGWHPNDAGHAAIAALIEWSLWEPPPLFFGNPGSAGGASGGPADVYTTYIKIGNLNVPVTGEGLSAAATPSSFIASTPPNAVVKVGDFDLAVMR